MKLLFSIAFVLVSAVLSMASENAFLNKIHWEKSTDSIVVNLEFKGTLPERYRVHLDHDQEGNLSVTASFLKATADTIIFDKPGRPAWLAYLSKPEQGKNVLRVHLFVTRKVAYRSEWIGNVFRIVIPNTVVESSPFWKKPWLYVGVAVASAGGALLWLTSGGSTPGTADIAPPDINLPD